MEIKVPLTRPSFSEAEVVEVRKVLRSGWVTQGPKVAEFEKKLREFLQTREIIAVSSCTTALHLCMAVTDIGPGDEVIVPSLTYIATVNAISYVGATPVFADIDLATYNLDPEDVEKKISRRTRAILAVHQIGLAANLESLRKLAKSYKLNLIEDAAPALGATYKKEMVGEKGLLVSFSLHPRKSITTGEGGFISTNNKSYANKLRVLRSHGASKSDYARHAATKIEFESFKELGYNYRLSDIAAAIGIVQLAKLPRILKRRRQLAGKYKKSLNNVKSVILPYEPEYAQHTYQSYQIRIAGITDEKRDRLIGWFLSQGIVTRRGVMASHLEPLYRKSVKASLPQTEIVFRESLLLPLFPDMTPAQQNLVVEKLKQGTKKLL